MKKVQFTPDTMDPIFRRFCSECSQPTAIRCMICRDYTCKKCIIGDFCGECIITPSSLTISGDNNE